MYHSQLVFNSIVPLRLTLLIYSYTAHHSTNSRITTKCGNILGIQYNRINLIVGINVTAPYKCIQSIIHAMYRS